MDSPTDFRFKPEIFHFWAIMANFNSYKNNKFFTDFFIFLELNFRLSVDHKKNKQPKLSLLPHLRLLPTLLESKGVYILDCTGQIFVWIGKHSQRLARAAAWKLASEMAKLPGR